MIFIKRFVFLIELNFFLNNGRKIVEIYFEAFFPNSFFVNQYRSFLPIFIIISRRKAVSVGKNIFRLTFFFNH